MFFTWTVQMTQVITPVTRKWICHLTALARGLQDWGG